MAEAVPCHECECGAEGECDECGMALCEQCASQHACGGWDDDEGENCDG